jgi:ABC-type polysaccharide/polyol phosphate export permease
MQLASDRGIFLSQVRALTVANLRARYRNTLAGFVWVALNPIVMFGVQSLVFSHFVKIDVPRFSLFLLTGLIPWIFISQSLDMCTPLFVNSGRVMKAFQIHPVVYLLAQLSDNAVNFFGTFLIGLATVWFFNPGSAVGLILLPLPLFCLFVGVFGLAWLLASVHVFFRDTKFIVSFVMTATFYLTPVFYPRTFVPEKWSWVVDVNPLFRMIEPFRVALYDFSSERFVRSIFYSALTAAMLLLMATLFWKKKRNEIFLNV